MKVGEVLRATQPDIYKKINKRKRKRKERTHKKENLSFSNFDYMMKHNKGIDPQKCR